MRGKGRQSLRAEPVGIEHETAPIAHRDHAHEAARLATAEQARELATDLAEAEEHDIHVRRRVSRTAADLVELELGVHRAHRVGRRRVLDDHRDVEL